MRRASAVWVLGSLNYNTWIPRFGGCDRPESLSPWPRSPDPQCTWAQTLARNESSTRPCPRLVLVCCSALVAAALDEPGIFREPASDEIVHFLLNS